MATNEEYQALIDSLSGECERLHKENEELKALSHEPCEDAISRDMALEKMADYVASGYADSAEDFEEYSRIICQLPSVTQKSVIEDIKADLINEANEHMTEGDYNDGVRFGLMLAEQIVCRHCRKKQKLGKWIEQEGWDGDVYYECSMCGEAFCLIDGTPTDNMYNYCPNCGAKMESETETWNGIHGQITAPKGTFEKIWEDAESEE